MALLGWLAIGLVSFLPAWCLLRLVWIVLRYNLHRARYSGFPRFPSSCAIIDCIKGIDPFLQKTWQVYQDAKVEGGFNPLFVHMGISFDGSHVLCTVDPEAMRGVMDNDKLFPKPEMYTSMVEILTGRGLVVLDGEVWKGHRRMLTPLFHFKPLKGYMPVMHQHCDLFAQEMLAAPQPVSMLPKVPHLTMSIICEIAVGGSIDPAVPLRIFKEAEQWFQPYYIAGLFLFGPWLWRKLVFLPPVFMVDHKLKGVREMVHNVIQDRRAGKNLGRGEDDVIGVLLSAQTSPEASVPLSDEDIVNEAITFLLAGHDTTSGIMSWMLYFLAAHPEYQEKLNKELVQVWPPGTEFNDVAEEVHKCELLKAVINETLRLRPNTPAWLDRVAKEDVKIAGKIVPKGTVIGLGFQFLQTNPDHWERAEEFWPERFTEGGRRDNYAFVPFSAGSRNCLGMKFAQQEMAIFVATLVRSTVMTLDSNHPVERKLVGMQVPVGLHLHFAPRTN
jgi:cytochrome P450